MTNWTRRKLLTRSLALGCSAAASPLITPVTLASAPWDNRLVVIILRGAMDGLDVVQPYGDPGYAAARPTLRGGEAGGALDLDGFYALHPALSSLMPMWRAGQLGFVHAVSTPYRDKRSHFDGQDLLEAGTPALGPASGRDGWLNRMLQSVPGLRADVAYAIGHDNMLLTTGAAPVANWSPDVRLQLSPQGRRLAELVLHDDPAFADAFAEAAMLLDDEGGGLTATPSGMGADMEGLAKKGTGGIRQVAAFAGEKLRADSRIAAFSIGGWDTHRGQGAALPRALAQLSDALLVLQATLGDAWGKTAVVAMTEFGRTVRENGTKGTDHGTGGAMVLAGGAVRGGQVYGDWPGLRQTDLYKGRDLMPTRDVRAYAGWMMRGLFGLESSVLERTVFPGMDLGTRPNVIL
ncbi:DUF1501 domain-containing protein [Thalassovita sp.]|uniref:DUF1501 domain-containing protein n=1 Tax=Thalassovita sp. TaxID=1979401 RepID=UPI0028818D4E|nr:DUF1501 domain-containing protein [Thalassovita sp.]MDF1802991.1 DUF1501 domain-containing protein [Thalassovita sp.]